jgi:hypothetical protein
MKQVRLPTTLDTTPTTIKQLTSTNLAKMALHQLGYTTTVRHVIWVAQLR